MRKTALVLAALAYLLPLTWLVALRSASGETVDGMFAFVTAAGSFVLALGLSGIATGLLVAARRDTYQSVLGSSALTRIEIGFVAAPAVAATLWFVAVIVTQGAA